MIDQITSWATVLGPVLVGLSVVLLVISAVGIPALIVWLPEDALIHPPVENTVEKVLRNLLGALMAVAGLAMLVLPGQGLITLFVAGLLLDFPGKARLVEMLVQRPVVQSTLQGIRRKAGKVPFILP